MLSQAQITADIGTCAPLWLSCSNEFGWCWTEQRHGHRLQLLSSCGWCAAMGPDKSATLSTTNHGQNSLCQQVWLAHSYGGLIQAGRQPISGGSSILKLLCGPQSAPPGHTRRCPAREARLAELGGGCGTCQARTRQGQCPSKTWCRVQKLPPAPHKRQSAPHKHFPALPMPLCQLDNRKRQRNVVVCIQDPTSRGTPSLLLQLHAMLATHCA